MIDAVCEKKEPKSFQISLTCSILPVVSGLFHGCLRCNLMVFKGVKKVFNGCECFEGQGC